MRIREYTDADWVSVWPIFRGVAGASDTFAYDPEWSPEQARDVWVKAPPGHTVVACDGPRVLGTAHMGPNRPGPGAHVATASVSSGALTRQAAAFTGLSRTGPGPPGIRTREPRGQMVPGSVFLRSVGIVVLLLGIGPKP